MTTRTLPDNVHHACERCGASPAYLFDHTPLEEHGTWERLCNDCIDKALGPWQGDDADYRDDAEKSKRSDPGVWRALGRTLSVSSSA